MNWHRVVLCYVILGVLTFLLTFGTWLTSKYRMREHWGWILWYAILAGTFWPIFWVLLFLT